MALVCDFTENFQKLREKSKKSKKLAITLVKDFDIS